MASNSYSAAASVTATTSLLLHSASAFAAGAAGAVGDGATKGVAAREDMAVFA